MMVQAPFQVALQSVRGARLVLTDPPYNLGFDYGAVQDDQDPEAYRQMVADFLRLAHEATADDASLMVVHYPEHFFELADVYRGSGWTFRQFIAWTYHGHTANATTTRLRRSHRQVLWMVKGNPPHHPERIPVSYRNPGDKRIKARMAAGHDGARPTDWWHIEQVKQGSAEHLGYSNQMPADLLRRAVLLTTEPGDLVADPFSGTGSTARAALAAGRRAWGCDANPATVAFWSDLEIRQEVFA